MSVLQFKYFTRFLLESGNVDITDKIFYPYASVGSLSDPNIGK